MVSTLNRRSCQSTGSELLDALHNAETALKTTAILSRATDKSLGLQHIEIPALKSTPIKLEQTARTIGLEDTSLGEPRFLDPGTNPKTREKMTREGSRAQAIARLSAIINAERIKTGRRQKSRANGNYTTNFV